MSVRPRPVPSRPRGRLCRTLAAAVLAAWFPARAQTAIPVPGHVIVVMEENQAYRSVIGSKAAPYINALAAQGALFTDSHGIGHPSQPNYLELFSGSAQGTTDDTCPKKPFTTPNLGGELLAAGLTFGGYSEDLPKAGALDCSYRQYWRKHNPWVDFADVPAALNMPFTAFPADFSRLPTIAFVVPNQDNDMHDGSIQAGDKWLKTHIDPYIQWAAANDGLLILTWDEDDSSAGNNNHMPTIFAGPMVRPGVYAERIDHYSVLRTLEEMFRLPYAGASAKAAPILDVWAAPLAPGDADGDGKIDIADVRAVLLSLVGGPPLTPAGAKAADLNGDGQVDLLDARLILLEALGL